MTLAPGLDGNYVIAVVRQPRDTDAGNDLAVATTAVMSAVPDLRGTKVAPPAEAFEAVAAARP